MGGGSGTQDENGRLRHGGRWLHAQQWPLPGSQSLTLYLDAQRQLTQRLPSADEAALGYYADPANPVPTVGGALT
ncbi:hypothetical protein, partial [Colwellia marinimaniae]